MIEAAFLNRVLDRGWTLNRRGPLRFWKDLSQKMHQTREMLNMSDIEALTVNISREMINMLNMLDFWENTGQ